MNQEEITNIRRLLAHDDIEVVKKALDILLSLVSTEEDLHKYIPYPRDSLVDGSNSLNTFYSFMAGLGGKHHNYITIWALGLLFRSKVLWGLSGSEKSDSRIDLSTSDLHAIDLHGQSDLYNPKKDQS